MAHRTRASLAALLAACASCSTPPPAASVLPPTVAGQTQAKTSSADQSGYDLAADLEDRADEAREQLGSDTKTEVVEDVFLVAGEPLYFGFDSGVSLTKRAIAAYFNGRFDARPTRAITIYLFGSEGPYESWCASHEGKACLSPYGYFDPDDRRMVMNAGLGLGTLTHELVHPLVETDFPTAPIWINEGIASLFEAPVMPKPGEIHGVKNWRYPKLRAAALGKHKERTEIDTLFGMTDDQFRDENEGLHYALARYFCQWLDERDRLWPFYRKWRDEVATDPTGEKTFVAIVGKTPKDANAEFRKWLLALE